MMAGPSYLIQGHSHPSQESSPMPTVPFTPALEGRYVPDPARIAAGIREALARPLLSA